MLLEVPIRSNTDIGAIKRPIVTNNWDVESRNLHEQVRK